MKLKLNNWQIVLIFFPLVIAFLGMTLSNIPLTNYKLSSSAINLLLTLSGVVAISYQGYLTTCFLNKINANALLFRINALIVPTVCILYLFFILFQGVDRFFVPIQQRKTTGPISIAEMGVVSQIGTIFMYYVLINFFFINNTVVYRKLKMIQDAAQLQRLTEDFLNPLKSLVHISIWSIALMFAITIVGDIVNYGILAK